MDEFESLSHTKWECKYHVVFIPKYRRKVLYGELKKYLGPVFRQLADQRVPPKYSVSQVIGYIKGKSAIHLARVYGERKRGFVGQSFWARGYFVSTVGRDEAVVRDYIKNQESEDQKLEQMNLWR
jgi:putative transposase